MNTYILAQRLRTIATRLENTTESALNALEKIYRFVTLSHVRKLHKYLNDLRDIARALRAIADELKPQRSK